MKIAALHLHNFLEYAQIRGVLVPKLAAGNTAAPANATDDLLMIPEPDFYAALKQAHQQIQDDLWGIKAGNYLTLKLLGLIYQISLQATTLEEAFHYLHSYLQTTLPLLATFTQVTQEQATITLQINNHEEQLNRVIMENVLTIISREITMMVSGEVEFTLSSPFWHSSYPKNWVYGATYSISFAPITLKAAIRKRSEEKLEILIPEYIKLLEVLKAADSNFPNQVKITMLALSDPLLPDIAAVSETLCLTPRTLQRRLERENSSYRLLSQDLKKQICSFLLQHQEYSVTNLAYVLGYAEPAAFIHSFKKWFGDSPDRIRRKKWNAASLK
ncbi:helix-turn-helix domain-containing protein [Adhaeribacter swui]|uniref:Helix-turn-helix domain-containing protein n=1 Tax=Adhaeribacter swui TaxID=2086471 RepID=A0A7G7GE90_9BACT|nr:AraC family transcriptional regulator [Adhaeribacter swui]QNF35474.1 helix-turn-helix domain-containing protein [Adhaeribacter swui]